MVGMVRRSTPQSKLDDIAFPVRVKFAIPPWHQGWSTTYDRMHEWLARELGTYRHAWHGARVIGCGDAFAIYFRTPADAQRFVEAFPDMALADGVGSGHYSRHGRTISTAEANE